MRGSTLLLIGLSLGFCGVAGPVSAQQTAELDRVMRALDSLWQRGDAGGVAALGAGTGLDLEVHGQAMGPLRGRRAAAELRQLFSGQQTVSVRTANVSLVAGTNTRAFAELHWAARPAAGLAVEHRTVFVGLVREPRGWRISQIRVFP